LKLPRDVSGEDLARALRRFGYELTRQTGSHMRLTSIFKGSQHHVTVPAHPRVKIGTLADILNDVALYLDVSRERLVRELFG
jgi:predicted RNA binding protein YcfA (HicA-like mRNA interferase family)